jgi:hypothetical protein
VWRQCSPGFAVRDRQPTNLSGSLPASAILAKLRVRRFSLIDDLDLCDAAKAK